MKVIDYPRTSLRSALALAEAVDGFAGSCTAELAAEKLGKKLSGAFSAQVGGTVKYGFIDSKKGRLSVTPLYKNYKLAYSPEEAQGVLKTALLSPPLFSAIFNRFVGQRLPVEHFEKLLIREFQVPTEIASRVSTYFLEGAKQAGLLNAENFLVRHSDSDTALTTGSDGAQDESSNQDYFDSSDSAEKGGEEKNRNDATDVYTLNIRGPSMNFSLDIREADDLEIVRIMLRKIERSLESL